MDQITEQHKLKIARRTLTMPDPMIGVMGGPSKAKAKETVSKAPYDITGNIIAFESGELDRKEMIELFQHLVNTGLAWKLKHSYARLAMTFINMGVITQPKT